MTQSLPERLRIENAKLLSLLNAKQVNLRRSVVEVCSLQKASTEDFKSITDDHSLPPQEISKEIVNSGTPKLCSSQSLSNALKPKVNNLAHEQLDSAASVSSFANSTPEMGRLGRSLSASKRTPNRTPVTIRRGRSLVDKYVDSVATPTSGLKERRLVDSPANQRPSSTRSRSVLNDLLQREDNSCDSYLRGLRQFRDRFANECTEKPKEPMDNVGPGKTPPRQSSLHTCIHSYAINERLFAYPLNCNERGESICPICERPRLAVGDAGNRPTFYRVAMPLLASDRADAAKQPPAEAVKAAALAGDSLALVANCRPGYITHWTSSRHPVRTHKSLALVDNVTKRSDPVLNLRHAQFLSENAAKELTNVDAQRRFASHTSKREQFFDHLQRLSLDIERRLAGSYGANTKAGLRRLSARVRKLERQLGRVNRENSAAGATDAYDAPCPHEASCVPAASPARQQTPPHGPSAAGCSSIIAEAPPRAASSDASAHLDLQEPDGARAPLLSSSRRAPSALASPSKKAVSFADQAAPDASPGRQRRKRLARSLLADHAPPAAARDHSSRSLTEHLLRQTELLKREMNDLLRRKATPSA